MKSMPKIKPGDWISIGERDCVVAHLFNQGSSLGVGEVVFNPEKPTSHDFDWDGEKFIFPKRGDFGGYAERNSRYSHAVRILKTGRAR